MKNTEKTETAQMPHERKRPLFSRPRGNQVFFNYLMRELFLYFFIAFLFFFMIFFVNQILLMAEELLKKKVPFLQVAQLVTYSLPFVIAQSAPFATLVGFLMCLGRMMSDNEIMIFRATGHSYGSVMVPVLVLGVLISIASFFVNDYLLPLGTVEYNRLYQSILFSNPSVEIESNSIKRTQNSTLIIGEVNDRTVSDLILFDSSDRSKVRIIVSEETQIVSPDDPGVLMQLEMGKPVAFFVDKSDKTSFDLLKSTSSVMNIFSSDFFVNSSGNNPREMTAPDLKKEIENMRADPLTSDYQLNIWELEYYKKFSLPFGSVFFAILAMPLAVVFGKHNGQTIGLIIGIVLSVAYWAMFIMGQTFGLRNGVNGFWAMWLPNFLIGGTGIVFYIRLVRR